MEKQELLAKVREVDQGTDSPPENSFTADEYAEFTSMSQGNARHHLRQLAKKGKVKVVFHGLKGRVSYALTEPPGMDSLRELDRAADKVIRG